MEKIFCMSEKFKQGENTNSDKQNNCYSKRRLHKWRD